MTRSASNRLLSSAIWLKAFVLIVCLAILALEGWRDWKERGDELVRIKGEMTNLAKSLAQHVEDTFELANAILTDVVDRLEEGGAAPEVAMGMDHLLSMRIQPLQYLKSLTVYGEDGRLLSSSLDGHRNKVNATGKAFFEHHRASPDRKWFFGPLIHDPLGGDWVLTLSRRINKPDGSFGGVAQVSIPPRYFANFFGRFNVGSQGTFVLLDADKTLLARYPYLEQAIGTVSAPGLLQSSGFASGSVEYVSSLDGVERIAGYQRNHIFPVIVLSGVGRDEVLAAWNQEFITRSIGVALLLVMIGGLGWNLAGQLKGREKAEAELAVLATTDSLTGLANRRSFDKQIETEWLRASREGTPLSLLLIDVDQFKSYNDIYGHQAGDECLRAVADVLSRAARRPGDLVARYGGEEVAVLLPDTDDAGAATVAENIRAQVEALALRHSANPPSGIVTISIGSATLVPAHERSPGGTREIIALADNALYRSKQDGRNRVSVAKAA
jgi:diguanylate cyclase (GGDEF)-like protein